MYIVNVDGHCDQSDLFYFPAVGVILKYIRKGVKLTKDEFSGAGEGVASLLDYLDSVETVKSSRDEQLVSRLIEKHKLYWEHIPTWMHNSKEVSSIINSALCLIISHA